MFQDNLVGWIALARLFYRSPRKAHKLLTQFGTPENIFKSGRAALESILGPNDSTTDFIAGFSNWSSCESDIKRCADIGARIIVYSDGCYPPLLRMIDDPPLALFVRGSLDILHDVPCVAIVGARKSTREGRSCAFEIARGLAKRGVTVVSGMAFGIDAAAHEGCLEGNGRTVAVWGTGPDIVYPGSHAHLCRRILEKGTVVTEFPPGVRGEPYHFPQRNRVISGLCLGVIVVEAAEKSGSLITAEFALEQGREVMSVPGLPGHKHFRGSNSLIKNGAMLVESADDVIEVVFGGSSGMKKTGQSKKLPVRETDPDEGQGSSYVAKNELHEDSLLNFFESNDVLGLDQLIEMCGENAASVIERITEYVIDERLEELPGKRFKINKT